MRSYILYLIFALLSAPGSPRTLDSDSSDEDGVTLDLDSVRNAAQILHILQDMNERSSDIHVPPGLYKNQRRPQGRPTTPSGIDLDYIGASAEQYIDVNTLMRLVQKNYEANKNSAWMRAETTPRVYYISNPEILEEYWRSLRRKPQYGFWRHLKEKDSSQAEYYDSRNQFGDGINKNLLKFVISQRRDGADGNGKDIYVKDYNRIEDNEEDILKQHRTVASNKVKLKPKDNSRKDKGVSFKTHEDYYDEKKTEKKKPKLNYKAPAKVRDRGDKSAAESFKGSWKTKKVSTYREPIRTSRRYDDPPERSIFSKPRQKARNKGNMGNYGGYKAYGRTPVPFVGKRGIYEED